MAVCEISNGKITAAIDTFGAELKSLRNAVTEEEYMWCGDAQYWGKTSPNLFPFIGMLKNGEFRYGGESYKMTKHGFARDMKFKLMSHEAAEVWFVLESDEVTRQMYPFDFRLEIGYRLDGMKLKMLWRVENPSDESLHFSIGGHPAFNCPLDEQERREDYYLKFYDRDCIRCTVIGENGLVGTQKVIYELEDGILSVKGELFDHDAMVLEDGQVHKISLLTPDKEPYISVEFDTPVVAVWTPAGIEAPFICIEPWYGLCDSEDFEGTIEERKWNNEILPGKRFAAEYSIIIER